MERLRPSALSRSEVGVPRPKPDLTGGVRTTATVERVVVTESPPASAGRIEGTLDLVRSELDVPLDELWEPPDPSVPRGWSGGVFEVEPLGAEEAFPLSGHGIEEDRGAVFGTGC